MSNVCKRVIIAISSHIWKKKMTIRLDLPKYFRYRFRIEVTLLSLVEFPFLSLYWKTRAWLCVADGGIIRFRILYYAIYGKWNIITCPLKNVFNSNVCKKYSNSINKGPLQVKCIVFYYCRWKNILRSWYSISFLNTGKNFLQMCRFHIHIKRIQKLTYSVRWFSKYLFWKMIQSNLIQK